MSNLLRAGILLPDTINILVKTSGNMHFRESLAEVRKQLVQGESLSSAIGKNKVFPPYWLRCHQWEKPLES